MEQSWARARPYISLNKPLARARPGLILIKARPSPVADFGLEQSRLKGVVLSKSLLKMPFAELKVGSTANFDRLDAHSDLTLKARARLGPEILARSAPRPSVSDEPS